ncbi:unnamed protein product, partial [Symbiodinium sp. KB8]
MVPQYSNIATAALQYMDMQLSVQKRIASLVAAAEGAAESLESHDVTVEQSFKQEEAEATEKKLKQVLDELDLTKKEHEEMDKQ